MHHTQSSHCCCPWSCCDYRRKSATPLDCLQLQFGPSHLLLLRRQQERFCHRAALVPVGVPHRRAHAALAACVGLCGVAPPLLLHRAQLREGRIRPHGSSSSRSSSSSSGAHSWPHGMQGAQLRVWTDCLLLGPAAAAAGVCCWSAAAAVAVDAELAGRRFQPAATASAASVGGGGSSS